MHLFKKLEEKHVEGEFTKEKSFLLGIRGGIGRKMLKECQNMTATFLIKETSVNALI